MNLLLLLFTVAVAGQQTFDLQLRFVGVLPGNYETKVKDVDTGTVERDRFPVLPANPISAFFGLDDTFPRAGAMVLCGTAVDPQRRRHASGHVAARQCRVSAAGRLHGRRSFGRATDTPVRHPAARGFSWRTTNRASRGPAWRERRPSIVVDDHGGGSCAGRLRFRWIRGGHTAR